MQNPFFSKATLSTTNWIIKSWGMSSLLHFPWVTPEFPASPARDWGKGYWALSNRTNVYRRVPCRPAIQWGATLGSLRTARLHHAFECISMQLALAQPWRILFPQSHAALISGNTRYYMRANSLILFVRLRWSATYSLKSQGDCLFEKKGGGAHWARWISCSWDFSGRMLYSKIIYSIQW